MDNKDVDIRLLKLLLNILLISDSIHANKYSSLKMIRLKKISLLSLEDKPFNHMSYLKKKSLINY